MRIIRQHVGEDNRFEFEFSDDIIAFFPNACTHKSREHGFRHCPLLLTKVAVENPRCSALHDNMWKLSEIAPGAQSEAARHLSESKYNTLGRPDGWHTGYAFGSLGEFAAMIGVYSEKGFVTEAYAEAYAEAIQANHKNQTTHAEVS